MSHFNNKGMVYSGSSLTGRSVELVSNSIRSNRTCTIQIANHLNIPLTDPKWYCSTGCPYYQMQPVIQPRSREACSFSKKRDTNVGVVGVLSYQFGDSPLRFAVMYSVPYNQLEVFNFFGMAFLNNEKAENYDLSNGSLFDKMYYEEDFYVGMDKIRSEANGGTVFIENRDYKICGTMSERGKAILKLDVTYR